MDTKIPISIAIGAVNVGASMNSVPMITATEKQIVQITKKIFKPFVILITLSYLKI